MKTKSSNSYISDLVKRGYDIRQQLIIFNEEFEKIKDQLKDEAAAKPDEHLPLLDKESSGKQWIAKGGDCECRIVFPSPKIKTDFDPSESDFLTIRSLAGDHFKDLFRKVTLYRPTEKSIFKNQATHLLAPKAASQLIELCSMPSEPKAFWKTCPVKKEIKK